jgi:hypothetical protein
MSQHRAGVDSARGLVSWLGMQRKRPDPFAHNPLRLADKLELVKVPDAPETHEVRKPLRSYLAPKGALGGDAGGPPPKVKKIIERVKEAPSAGDDDDSDLPIAK